MANKDVRKYAKEHGVKLWQCASYLGFSEPTMTRRLRTELCNAEKDRLFKIIDRIAEENNEKQEETA